MPICFRVLFSVIFLAVMSGLFAWFLELRCRLGDVDATNEWIGESPLVFTQSCVIIFLILCTISALLWRVFLGTGIVFAIVSVVSFINAEKYKLRATPLLPEDFRMIDATGEVAAFVDPWSIARLVIGVILVILGSALLEYYVRRSLGRNTQGMPWWQRWSVIPRATFTLLSAVALMLATNFAIHYDNANQEIDWLNTKFIAWNQDLNYKDNGFLISFLYNIGRTRVVEPENYSEKTIEEIFEKYQKLTEDDSNHLPELSDQVDNIIIVLDETFYDVELLDKYYPHTGGDLLPNLHEIFSKYPSGYMYSPEYGGNTANIEFEVLTSLSNYWGQTTPYTGTLSKVAGFPSFVGTIKQRDFDTTAIHAYDGSVYKRNIVYQNIGYDKFIDNTQMKYHEIENGHGYPSDSNLYKEAIDIISENDGKQFIGLVTMQNHSPYNGAWYDDFDFQILGHTDDYPLRCNFQSLHIADQYLGDFIAALDKVKEKTVVLWFGDHAAGLLGDYASSGDKADRDLAHLTPYFIYANFEISSNFTTKQVASKNKEQGLYISTSGVDLPTTTPNCLVNTMYSILGAKKDVLMEMLDEVCKIEPILTQAYLEGRPLADENVIYDYELVNYDLLYGKRYWVEKLKSSS